MNMIVVVISVCMLIAQATCAPALDILDAVSETIEQMQKKINSTLGNLAEKFPDEDCVSVNITQQVQTEVQLGIADHLNPFKCPMEEMSNLTTEFYDALMELCQHIQNLGGDSPDDENCRIPSFKQERDKYLFLKCLLQSLYEQLSKPFTPVR